MPSSIGLLILGPILVGCVLCLLRSDIWRKWLVGASALSISAGSVALVASPSGAELGMNRHWVDAILAAVDVAMGGYILYVGWKARRPLIIGLIVAQLGIMAAFELSSGPRPERTRDLFADNFSLLMVLINGVVGSGICLYALGYMRDYHNKAHPEVADRRPFFFSLLFIFLGSMYGIILSNNLVWLFAFWEITTLCSFLLIGYTRTKEAQHNALQALAMNLAGGLAFAIAIVWAYRQTGSLELQGLLASKKALALMPAALLCFAGITKSAQLPFSSWLLGAMVAPTPVSALLHSSTMVKAGVYLVLRMAPLITGTGVGLLVALVGGVTFLVGSLAAITTSDAKKVLAHSTVANLGLVVLCGGVGTPAALWAGLLLILFHALAKCLLFLCVGVVEQELHSRDIESMSGLILNAPAMAIMMLIGMAGMFLAPFGMLISKWAVLKAVVDAYPLLSVFIIFGSAGTLFFWVKWMGKLLEVVGPHEPVAIRLAAGENIALYGLSAGTFLACLLFPFISSRLIEPYVAATFGSSVSMSAGNITIMLIMMVMILLFPLSFLHYGRGVRVTDAYLGGANLQGSTRFMGSAKESEDVRLNNYYLRNVLPEALFSRWGAAVAALLLCLMPLMALLPLL